jgi:hypothetical protein
MILSVYSGTIYLSQQLFLNSYVTTDGHYVLFIIISFTCVFVSCLLFVYFSCSCAVCVNGLTAVVPAHNKEINSNIIIIIIIIIIIADVVLMWRNYKVLILSTLQMSWLTTFSMFVHKRHFTHLCTYITHLYTKPYIPNPLVQHYPCQTEIKTFHSTTLYNRTANVYFSEYPFTLLYSKTLY